MKDKKYFIPFCSDRFSVNIYILEFFRVVGSTLIFWISYKAFFDLSLGDESFIYGGLILVFGLASYYSCSKQIKDYSDAIIRKEIEERKRKIRKS